MTVINDREDLERWKERAYDYPLVVDAKSGEKTQLRIWSNDVKAAVWRMETSFSNQEELEKRIQEKNKLIDDVAKNEEIIRSLRAKIDTQNRQLQTYLSIEDELIELRKTKAQLQLSEDRYQHLVNAMLKAKL